MMAVVALMEAFKGRESVRFYIEHRVPNSSARPADVLIVSRDTGFILVEVKGFIIQNIDSVTGSTIKGDFYSSSGKELDVFAQAESSMYGFKRHYEEKARRKDTKGSPQFDFFVFFPSISVKDWEGRGYNECMSMEQLLFKEDYDYPDLIAKKNIPTSFQGQKRSSRQACSLAGAGKNFTRLPGRIELRN
ncbi:MAG: hypothetical protein U9Q00_10500 [Synergistota bacterium]|nr:hypothetical protein [Synergistota bacterium]